MQILNILLNLASASFALFAAYYWWRGSNVPLPESVDSGDLDDKRTFFEINPQLALPGILNSKGAMYAAFAALSQFLVAALAVWAGLK